MKKIGIVTGANAGLGLETTKALAGQGVGVIMISRSPEKGQKALQLVREQTGNKNIHLFIADLASQPDIRSLAVAIRERWDKIDFLVNNAATIFSDYTTTQAGIETQFAVNHLGYFLLTHLLMDSLRASVDARIVNVGSRNHFRGQMNYDNLNLEGEYQVLKAYNQSKLANVLFTYELDRRLRARSIGNVTVNCVDPGTNNTDIGIKATRPLHALAWRLRRAIAQGPAKGVQCQVELACADQHRGISGKYWANSKPTQSSRLSYDEESAIRLWQASMKLTQVEDFFDAG